MDHGFIFNKVVLDNSCQYEKNTNFKKVNLQKKFCIDRRLPFGLGMRKFRLRKINLQKKVFAFDLNQKFKKWAGPQIQKGSELSMYVKGESKVFKRGFLPNILMIDCSHSFSTVVILPTMLMHIQFTYKISYLR